MFISLEGIDGAGKTTQLELLAAWLQKQALDVVTVREPGGTPAGEKIRELLLSTTKGPQTAAAELLLYAAARAELVAAVIKPALDEGRIVIADRFSDSTWAYQVWGRGLKPRWVQQVVAGAVGELEPDLTLLFDLSPALALARVGTEDRLEQESLDFFARVRRGYLSLAEKNPKRMRIIGADNKSIEAVQALVRREVGELVPSLRRGQS